jgi:hypothetical protein
VQIQKEKEQLLAEQIGVKEAVTRELLSVTGLESNGRRPSGNPSRKLVEAIQQLQQRIEEL